MDLTTAAREKHELRAALKVHLDAAATEEKRLRSEIGRREAVLNMSADGIDPGKVALAKTIVFSSDYERGGKDRASCVADAVKQLSTGQAVRTHYGDLWRVFFGTKNYDRWQGQRDDCQYGYGPTHGSTCFQIGITEETLKRKQSDLTSEEIEAAIYYLVNLERIQVAEKKALQAATAA